MRAGLIPSRALQERRILHERTQVDKNNAEGLLNFLLSYRHMIKEIKLFKICGKISPSFCELYIGLQYSFHRKN